MFPNSTDVYIVSDALLAFDFQFNWSKMDDHTCVLDPCTQKGYVVPNWKEKRKGKIDPLALCGQGSTFGC